MYKHYDKFTIDYSDINYRGYYGKMIFEIYDKVFDVGKRGQRVIRAILKMLNDDTIDHKTLIGEAGYRYIIRCNQRQLADLIGIEETTLTKGIKELEEANLIVREFGIIYVNPLLFNTNKIVDINTLQKFNINYNKKSDKINRDKVTEPLTNKGF